MHVLPRTALPAILHRILKVTPLALLTDIRDPTLSYL